MTLFKTLKRDARNALSGNWSGAVPGMLIYGGAAFMLWFARAAALRFITVPTRPDPAFAGRYGFDNFFFARYLQTGVPENIFLLGFTVLSLLLMAPLMLGLIRWYRLLAYGGKPSLIELFHFFSSGRNYLRALWLHLNLTVRTYLWAAVFFAVPGAIFAASVLQINHSSVAGQTAGALATVGIAFSAVLTLLAMIFYCAFINKYFLAFYLICEDDSLSVRQAIRSSAAFTRGSRFGLLWFTLSFTGWYLLCIVFFPVFYVFPYVNAAFAMYAKHLIEKKRNPLPAATREFNTERAGDLPLEGDSDLTNRPTEQPEPDAWLPGDLAPLSATEPWFSPGDFRFSHPDGSDTSATEKPRGDV